MTSTLLSSKRHKYPLSWQPPHPPFHLDAAYIHYERLQLQQSYNKKKSILRKGKEGSLSCFTLLPVDVFYEIIRYLHPQDVLSLARSTRRLRQLLMTRDARFAWKSALSNAEGLPCCPSDLSEPQYANLAFDQHCHLCLAPRVQDVLWSCRIRSCKKCIPKCFLRMDELVLLLPKTLDTPKPETIFLYIVYPKPKSGNSGTIWFYKPVVEAYLRELAELDESDKDTLSRWCNTKRMILDRTKAHAALCEHWAYYWAYPDTTHQLYDFGFTLCLLGLLVFLWKDKLFD